MLGAGLGPGGPPDHRLLPQVGEPGELGEGEGVAVAPAKYLVLAACLAGLDWYRLCCLFSIFSFFSIYLCVLNDYFQL